jgi:acetyl-CoA carboxylase carboxyl transferase subunit beta
MLKEIVDSSVIQQATVTGSERSLPVNLVVKCPQCKDIVYGRDLVKNLKVCPRCGHHFRLTAKERITLLVDADSFVETDADIVPADPLVFSVREQSYAYKAQEERKKTGINEAVITGYATIQTKPLAMAVMDFHFIGGSMSSVVGEKITRAIELGIEKHLPVLIVAASGGARMQEGVYSLMQLTKTTSALIKLKEAKLPFISFLTDPTSGGVTASFAMLGDVILAEPKALVCFAGPRVIEDFMHTKLPEGTASSEFAYQHGMIDGVVHRKDMRQTLGRLLRFFP